MKLIKSNLQQDVFEKCRLIKVIFHQVSYLRPFQRSSSLVR